MPNLQANLTINRLPDELLLEIFDSYRQDIDPYDLQWRKKHVWIDLTHVCRKWRAVVFASYSRLDLGITIGPEKPGHIKTILSGHLPISINYGSMYGDITGSILWRMRAALNRRDRVREIAFEGTSANFDRMLKMTQCAFPVLESLVLRFKILHSAKLPDTFLRGPDLSVLHLRHLRLEHVSLESISEFLLSATAVTDLILQIEATPFSSSPELPEESLLTCLQGMPCLRHLELFTASGSPPSTTSKDVVRLSKLTDLIYDGHSAFFDNLVAGLSAPSLRDVDIQFFDVMPHDVHLPRFINEIEEQYHAVHVTFQEWDFQEDFQGNYSFSLQTQSEYNNHCKPRFNFGPVMGNVPDVIRMSGVLSTRLSTVEELRVTLEWTAAIPWRGFLQHFPRLKALRTEGANNDCIARALLQGHRDPDDGLAFLSTLEEIELGRNPLLTNKSHCRHELAVFEPFISARQQAGRPVKVFFSP